MNSFRPYVAGQILERLGGLMRRRDDFDVIPSGDLAEALSAVAGQRQRAALAIL